MTDCIETRIIRLLIVDDSATIRNEITHHLKDKGYDVVATAQNAEEAIFYYDQTRPDVVSMDLTMMQTDGQSFHGGLEAIEKIVAKYPDANILVISGLTDLDTGLQALDLGAKGFINKPFDGIMLDEAFRRMLENE